MRSLQTTEDMKISTSALSDVVQTANIHENYFT